MTVKEKSNVLEIELQLKKLEKKEYIRRRFVGDSNYFHDIHQQKTDRIKQILEGQNTSNIQR